jgi:hypothetical protein
MYKEHLTEIILNRHHIKWEWFAHKGCAHCRTCKPVQNSRLGRVVSVLQLLNDTLIIWPIPLEVSRFSTVGRLLYNQEFTNKLQWFFCLLFSLFLVLHTIGRHFWICYFRNWILFAIKQHYTFCLMKHVHNDRGRETTSICKLFTSIKTFPAGTQCWTNVNVESMFIQQ